MAISSIEQVTNNSGTGFCKMPDGTLICYGSFSTGVGTYDSFGGMFVKDISLNVGFPVAFVATPAVSILNVSNTAFAPIRIERTKEKLTLISLMRQNNYAGAEGSFSYIAIGRWK